MTTSLTSGARITPYLLSHVPPTCTVPDPIPLKSSEMKSRDQEVMRHSAVLRMNASPDLKPADCPGKAVVPLVSLRDLVLLAGVFFVSRVILHWVFSVQVDTWFVNQLHHIPPPYFVGISGGVSITYIPSRRSGI